MPFYLFSTCVLHQALNHPVETKRLMLTALFMLLNSNIIKMFLTYTRYHYDKNYKLLLTVILSVTARGCMGLSHETQKLRKVSKSSKQNFMRYPKCRVQRLCQTQTPREEWNVKARISDTEKEYEFLHMQFCQLKPPGKVNYFYPWIIHCLVSYQMGRVSSQPGKCINQDLQDPNQIKWMIIT